MAKYELPLPPESLAEQFRVLIEPFIGKIMSNIPQSQTLAEMRDRLLPKLISGKIRVKEAEQMVEEAL